MQWESAIRVILSIFFGIGRGSLLCNTSGNGTNRRILLRTTEIRRDTASDSITRGSHRGDSLIFLLLVFQHGILAVFHVVHREVPNVLRPTEGLGVEGLGVQLGCGARLRFIRCIGSEQAVILDKYKIPFHICLYVCNHNMLQPRHQLSGFKAFSANK